MRGYAELLNDYATSAQAFQARWEEIDPDAWLSPVVPFIQGPRILDVGAGTGHLSGYLLSKGYRVQAVEPVTALWAEPRIPCLQDTLPRLRLVHAAYDTVFCLGVLHHLTPRDQIRSVRRMSELLGPNGRLILATRHGPSPRRAWPVCATQFAGSRLAKPRLSRRPSLGRGNRALHVRWTWLVFQRSSS